MKRAQKKGLRIDFFGAVWYNKAENDDISIFDLIRDDKDLFKHQRAYELRREHRRVNHLGDSYRQMLRERKDSQRLTAVKHVLSKPLPCFYKL